MFLGHNVHRDGGRKWKPRRQRPKQRQYKGRKKMLEAMPHVELEGAPLKYKMEVVYMGHIFQGDGGCEVDVTCRCGLARRKLNELMWLWRDNQISETLKMRVYERNVNSIVVWGVEGWPLTDKIENQ